VPGSAKLCRVPSARSFEEIRSVPLLRPRALPLLAFPLIVASACAPAAAPAAAPWSTQARTEWQVPQTPPPAPIAAAEFAERRAALAREMGDGVFVAFGSPEPEFDYLPYAQNANFRYLTGVVEPGAALIIEKTGGVVREHLFVQPRNPAREVWEGARLGPEGAQALTGIPSRTTDRLRPALDSLVARHRALYVVTPLPADPAAAETLTREQQVLTRLLARHPGTRATPLTQQIRRLRATKSAGELDMLRRAVYISVLAHREAMRSVQPGMNEFEIQALVEYFFRRNGAERPAYSSIVGSGPNSTTLHYNANDRFMRDGEVLLMDVGASYRGYAADVTRTMPINGRFSPEQREIYGIVLDAQKTAEQTVRPGNSWMQVSAAADRVLAEGLARVGLIDAPDATYDCQAGGQQRSCSQFRLFYMHGLGHGVGLDVHDPDVYLTLGEYRPGSAFTIEPGIYVRGDVFDYLPDTPGNRAMIERRRAAVERYRDIGVRIEDVYFLTNAGVERLSAGVPREIDDVEALMREPGLGEQLRRPDVVEWYRETEPGRRR
jgi:Xaa-Pro aminopeptidase